MQKFTNTIILFFITIYSFGQITTSGIRGNITTGNNKPLPNASIKAVLLSTGEKYSAISQQEGNFIIANMKSGGPYSIITSYTGFHNDTTENVYLALGKFQVLEVTLVNNAATLSEITILANAKNKISFGNNINSTQLSQLPTLNRSLQDFTRLTSQANGNSFAGANYRYNNLSVDGASLNDAFGFTESLSGAAGSLATGNPGGLAKTQPISLEAIQEVQVELSPFNVVLGNFTGGSVNAVTKSGTKKN